MHRKQKSWHQSVLPTPTCWMNPHATARLALLRQDEKRKLYIREFEITTLFSLRCILNTLIMLYRFPQLFSVSEYTYLRTSRTRAWENLIVCMSALLENRATRVYRLKSIIVMRL